MNSFARVLSFFGKAAARVVLKRRLWGGLLCGLAAVGLFTATAPAAHAAAPCCAITAVNASTGVVTARVNASGQIFTFRLQNPRLTLSLKVGQPVYANFGGKQVSLDGKSVSGPILSMGAAPAAGAPAPRPAGNVPGSAGVAPMTPAPTAGAQAPRPGGNVPGSTGTAAPTASAPINPGGGSNSTRPVAGSAIAGHTPISLALPQISYGTPQPVPRGSRGIARGLQNTGLVHLRGLEGIAGASNVPQGVKDFLLLHARGLPPDQVDSYIVNVPLAEQWLKEHPEPEAVKKAAASHNSHAGCHAISVKCAEEGAQHAEGEAERQAGKLWKAAQDEWKHVATEAARDWGQVQGCFADNTLRLRDIPVKFNLTPEIPLSFEKSGSSDNKHGSVSGNVSGTVTFGIPVDANFHADIDLFYIPCLPFVVRPRQISGHGVMGAGSTFNATLTATGEFTEEFIIPPSGGPHFPIYVIPIVIAGVPVAELDVSLYVDGRVNVDGKGTFNGNVKLEASQKMAFNFSCDGGGCGSNSHPIPVPATATESAKIDGRIHVKPSLYTALQLDFDVDLLSARVGPQPYLLGEIYGCAAASGTQNTSGQTSGQQSYALTADLDWGIDLLGEALIGNHRVGNPLKLQLKAPDHLYFQDLAQSTALIPAITSAGAPSHGRPAAYQLTMPACYPYNEPLQYQLAWTGGATTAGASIANSRLQPGVARIASSSACALQSGQGECWGDPHKATAFDLVWPQSGNYTLTVSSVKDKHGRKFAPPPSSQVSVNVQ